MVPEERIALIILNFNHAGDTLKLWSSLQSNLGKNYCYFIIDNNSEDVSELNIISRQNYVLSLTEKSYSLCENIPDCYSTVFIKLSQNHGYSKGNNYGLKLAFKGGLKYAFILNPDIEIIDYQVFPAILNLLKNNSQTIALAGPKILNSSGYKLGPFRRYDLISVFRSFLYPFSILIPLLKKQIELMLFGYTRVYSIAGCFFAMNLTLCAEVDFFDETTFLYWEELIISEKLKHRKKKVIYIPYLKVIHNHVYDENFFQNQYYLESKIIYENRYLKLNRLTIQARKISDKYYESTWGKLKKSLSRIKGNE